MIDPIVDLLNRIKNAQAVQKESVEVPFSNVKFCIAQIMEKYGFVGKVAKSGKKEGREIKIELKYDESGSARITGLQRISKQGQRIYSSYKDLKPVKGGSGIAIVSTPKGIMSHTEAIKKKVGGEVIAKIW